MPESATPAVAPHVADPVVTCVSLVLPCLNEEQAIGACITQALKVFATAGIDGQVLVVDNGSVDRSVEVAKEAGARVVNQPEPGYGAALRSGFEEAKSTYIVMADADGTYDLTSIPRLLQPLFDGEADLVIGSRLQDATKDTMPWLHKYLGTPILTMLLNRATGKSMKIRDSQSGLRAFRREQLLSLDLASTGMEFASEMLIRCAWARFRILEIPTKYSPRIGDSKLNTFPDGLRHLRQILLLSPEIFAIDPGMAMTAASIVLWIAASFSVHGMARVGSVGWIATVFAAMLSVIGPITYCTGLAIKYRAESLGFRNVPPKYPLLTLIWRFFFVGVGLIILSIILMVTLVVNFHHHPNVITDPSASVLGSVSTSAFIVGIVLACAPILTPFFQQAPRFTLPKIDIDT
jgi:glycosyltransferase involved in cell wall biosynthesis